MTKIDFLENLSRELKRKNISDSADIVEEYEQHFVYKLADGYSEEEIAAKLGDPKALASQYDAAPRESRGGKRMITVIGLAAADFFFGILCVFLYIWAVVMAAGSVAFAGICVALVARLGLMPAMPYHCAMVLGIAFGALTVLTAVGERYYIGFVRQLMRSFGRFHRNTLSVAYGRAPLPFLPVYPQFSPKTKRGIRKTAMAAVTAFAVCFIVGFVLCTISAGSLEFWHTWGWFGYT